MKFFYYDLIFLIIFCIVIALFLWKNKKNVKVENKIFVLYRTKVGLRLIDFVGTRYKKTFRILSSIIIFSGYFLMLLSIYLFYQLIIMFVKMPDLVRAAKIPPIMPLIPYLPQLFKIDFLPPFYFTYWIVVIAIIAIVHEFSHGIFARYYGIKVKSTGFGFLGPFLAAFVEPDEKQLQKSKKKSQLAVLAAGSFSNLVVMFIFIAVSLLFSYFFFMPAGIVYNTYAVSEVKIANITSIGNATFSSPDASDIALFLEKVKEGNDLIIKVDGQTINLTKVEANNMTYFTTINNLKTQLKAIEKNKQSSNNSISINLFNDGPMLRQGITDPIKSINSIEVRTRAELKNELAKYKPKEIIKIETINSSYKIAKHVIQLSENSQNKSIASLGIGFVELRQKGISGFFIKVFAKISMRYREQSTFYMPRYSPELIIFFDNLLWWLIIINLSVAIINMLPLGIFDGGRFFFITALMLTKSQKKAEKAFRAITYILLLILLLLMIMWWLFI